ncbi:hypothetical protein CDHC01_1208 [Corynebacterium diphtheriae HC01]|nr:hypothetical protein CD31A_1291 [Corynebacterium diphtheriae 31A]AEX44275.1 hypothetical protein CD241_1210 [Corynebacterium diphtheriae 241]AEX72176.1 hypothetical protein CDCE8392_1183 [Corynebacterium diphtheriae CDCE 8392]AEX74459.1 hypothetical protein CDHC01_1208 [Corynebacterium diphtheriae HC01]AEX78915.1 hypothetical protein CDHC03_1184 [Corynebacterium diphtheriae HC03]AEX81184.1 hypothetical protein CDHC04_1191 [Corynebacterium diphtheriae HC04]AEX83419.1 hypothetical protein CD
MISVADANKVALTKELSKTVVCIVNTDMTV